MFRSRWTLLVLMLSAAACHPGVAEGLGSVTHEDCDGDHQSQPLPDELAGPAGEFLVERPSSEVPGVGDLVIAPPVMVLRTCGRLGTLTSVDALEIVVGSEAAIQSQMVITQGTEGNSAVLSIFPAISVSGSKVRIFEGGALLATYDMEQSVWESLACTVPTAGEAVPCNTWWVHEWVLDEPKLEDVQVYSLLLSAESDSGTGYPIVYEVAPPSPGSEGRRITIATQLPSPGVIRLRASDTADGYHEYEPAPILRIERG